MLIPDMTSQIIFIAVFRHMLVGLFFSLEYGTSMRENLSGNEKTLSVVWAGENLNYDFGGYNMYTILHDLMNTIPV